MYRYTCLNAVFCLITLHTSTFSRIEMSCDLCTNNINFHDKDGQSVKRNYWLIREKCLKWNVGISVDIRVRKLYVNKVFVYPALVLFEQSNCIDWINFNICQRCSLSGTWFMLSDGKKREQYKRGFHERYHRITIRTTLVSAPFFLTIWQLLCFLSLSCRIYTIY